MEVSHGQARRFEEVEHNEYCRHILSEVAMGANSPLKQFVLTSSYSDKGKGRVAP